MRSTRGFSLVEVMVAAMILGIGVMAGIRVFGSSIDGVTSGRSRSTAATIATQRLESLGTQGVDKLPSCTGAVGCMVSPSQMATQLPNGCTEMISEGGLYRVDTIVAPHPDTARQPGARIATISVCWTEDQTVHQVQFNRIFVPNL